MHHFENAATNPLKSDHSEGSLRNGRMPGPAMGGGEVLQCPTLHLTPCTLHPTPYALHPQEPATTPKGGCSVLGPPPCGFANIRHSGPSSVIGFQIEVFTTFQGLS